MSLISLRPRGVVIGIVLLAVSLAHEPCQAQWTTQVEGTRVRYRGLCVVDSRVVWASGTQATVLGRSTGVAPGRAGRSSRRRISTSGTFMR